MENTEKIEITETEEAVQEKPKCGNKLALLSLLCSVLGVLTVALSALLMTAVEVVVWGVALAWGIYYLMYALVYIILAAGIIVSAFGLIFAIISEVKCLSRRRASKLSVFSLIAGIFALAASMSGVFGLWNIMNALGVILRLILFRI